MLVKAIGDGSSLAVLAAPDCDTRQISFEMTRLVGAVGELLTACRPCRVVSLTGSPRVPVNLSQCLTGVSSRCAILGLRAARVLQLGLGLKGLAGGPDGLSLVAAGDQGHESVHPVLGGRHRAR